MSPVMDRCCCALLMLATTLSLMSASLSTVATETATTSDTWTKVLELQCSVHGVWHTIPVNWTSCDSSPTTTTTMTKTMTAMTTKFCVHHSSGLAATGTADRVHSLRCHARHVRPPKVFRLQIVDSRRAVLSPIARTARNVGSSGSSGGGVRDLFRRHTDEWRPPLRNNSIISSTVDRNHNGDDKLSPWNRVTVNVNEPVTLRCGDNQTTTPEAIDRKSTIVNWEKDGKRLRSSSDTTATATTSTETSLESGLKKDEPRITINQNGSLVFAATVASDDGVYACHISEPDRGQQQAADNNSSPTAVIHLTVIESLHFMPQPTSKNLELGSVGKVHCKAHGSPTPTVHWRQRDTDMLPVAVDDVNGTLTFRNVSGQHKGNYTCVASNSQGSIRANIAVNVVVAPRFSIAPQSSVQAFEMDTAIFHCQAIGDPMPTVQWDRNLQYLNSDAETSGSSTLGTGGGSSSGSTNTTEPNHFQVLSNGSLFIYEVHLDDEGRYGCTIGNSAGLKREEVQLIVKTNEYFTAEESESGFMITRAVLITMSVALAYIVLVVSLMLWCRWRRRARKARIAFAGKENGAVAMGACGTLEAGDGVNGGGNAEIEPCLAAGVDSKSNPVSSRRSDADSASAHSKSSMLDQLSVSRAHLTELVKLGRGEFGDVFLGKLKMQDVKSSATAALERRKSRSSLEEEADEITPIADTVANSHTAVLVKALNRIKDEHFCTEFRRQIDLFRAVNHRSVAKLYGLCRDKDPHYILLEYTDWGDLKQFLIATTKEANGDTSAPPQLKVPQILALGHQLARGMDAIYKARLIHRDVATRNCIISSKLQAKISLPALSRDKYAREYYKYRNQLIPLRWLAPECLADSDYSAKSDVYAFGVLLWELFTHAAHLPFEAMSNEALLPIAEAGKLDWQCPDQVPSSVRTIFTSCWSANPKERPSFGQISSAITNCLKNEFSKDASQAESNN